MLQMIKIILPFYFFILGQLLFAQSEVGRNIVSMEVWGVGSFYSANYERVVGVSKKKWSMLSTGLGYYEKLDNSGENSFRLIPIRMFLSLGKKNVFAEVGFNYVFQFSTQKSVIGNTLKQNKQLSLLQLGIRVQKRSKHGLFFRAYILPVKEYGIGAINNKNYIFHLKKRFAHDKPPQKKYLIWGGIGLGYHFGK
jgi:hypothetical protein